MAWRKPLEVDSKDELIARSSNKILLCQSVARLTNFQWIFARFSNGRVRVVVLSLEFYWYCSMIQSSFL